MGIGSVLLLIILNFAFILLLFYFMRRSMEKRLRKIKSDMEELEDLAAAIIEELQERMEVNKDNNAYPEETTTDTDKETILNKSKPVTSQPKPTHLSGFQELAAERQEFKDPKHQKVLELFERGLIAEEIARNLNIGQGEVKLVLDFYKRS